MTVRKARDVESALLRKGFVQSNGDHRRFILAVDGQLTSVQTKMSHCGAECDDFIRGRMVHQLHLRAAELDRLLDCILGHCEYVKILRERGILAGSADN